MDKLFFSIVVPAHNEEKYLGSTLSHLRHLEYPAEKFEVLVVENGSSDKTHELAKTFEDVNVRVFQSGKGVSRAKNLGIDHLSPQSNWVIFLDADTLLEKGFLNELTAYLSNRTGLTVGTFSLRPLPETPYARAWFFVHNVGHMLSKTSFAIKMVRRDLFPLLRFDEDLVTAEDIHMIRQAQAHGKFFFMWTKSVSTSTRRFEKLGWWYVLFYWVFVALLPEKWQSHFTYEAAR
jgi:glycosyltransferase involved in cell wall biosynthesis